MQAIVQDSYGPPEILELTELPRPTPGDDEVLVEVHATSVTTADWRFREAAFPPGFRVAGRLMAGLFRPRNRVPGRDFSGVVVEVGSRVTRFQLGDAIFGTTARGATAEFIVVPESGAVVHKPAQLSHAEAAALPFGAISAVDFVRDRAKVQAGEHVLVVGGSGGVGSYAVQIARHLGAEVTAVCSTDNVEFVHALGATNVIDYTTHNAAELGLRFDVIIDTVRRTRFADYRPSLTDKGRHAFVEGGLTEMLQSLYTPLRGGPRVVSGVSSDTREALEDICALVEAGALRPIIGQRFALEQTVDAHRIVQGRHRSGAVIVEIAARSVDPEDRRQRPLEGDAGTRAASDARPGYPSSPAKNASTAANSSAAVSSAANV